MQIPPGPRFEESPARKFAGRHMVMSFTNNRTYDLWRSFMPLRHTITGQVGTTLYSMERYAPGYFDAFDPARPYEKWATVEIDEHSQVPEGMETLEVAAGLFAIFIHHGPASLAADTYGYIFRDWLPNSGYQLANRPHFAVMGDKYRRDDPDSEEEIWIPVERS